MLEFWRDGEKVECRPISGKGRVGQVVILDHVSFENHLDRTKHPLAAYVQPYPFTIVKKTDDLNGHYVLKDAEGSLVIVRDETFGASSAHLYDAGEWLAWRTAHDKEKERRKEGRIKMLEGHLNLLKSVLVQQGVRIISEKDAEKLGLGKESNVVYLVERKTTA